MRTLALDTSTSALTVAVVDSDDRGCQVRVVAERSALAERRHAELLAPLLREVLDSAASDPASASIAAFAATPVPAPHLTGGSVETLAASQRLEWRPDRIVVGVGPGPFTGLRVGVVTARSLGQAWDLPVVGVCSLDAIGAAASTSAPTTSAPTTSALSTAQADGGGDVVVATDARRKEVYCARYRFGRRVQGPGVMTPAQLAEQVARDPARVVGEGARRYPDRLGPGEPPWTPEAAWLVRALTSGLADPLGPVPLYLRRPDVAMPSGLKTVLP